MNNYVVIEALRNSEKGRLKYDRYWQEEGRTKEILNEISADLKRIVISPKAVTALRQHDHSYCKVPISGIKEEERKEENLSVRSKAEVESPREDVTYLQRSFAKELPILEYEEERKKCVQDLHNAKKKEFEAFDEKLSQAVEERYLLSREKQQLESLRRAAELDRYQQKVIDAVKQIQENRNIENEKAKVDEAKKCLEKNEKEQELLRRLLKEYHYKILLNFSQTKEAMSCCQIENLSSSCGEWLRDLTRNISAIGDLVMASSSSPLTSKSISDVELIVKQTENLTKNILDDAERANRKALEIEEANQREFQSTPLKHVPSARPDIPIPPIVVKIENSNSGVDAAEESQKHEKTSEVELDDMEEGEIYNEGKEALASTVDPQAFREYCIVMQNLKKVESSFEQFKMNPKHKKYRLELHKAVAINTISDVSGMQLKAKITHLLNLLSGQTVESGGKYVSCKNDPAALSYCKNLLAEKIVTQGEEQVRSKIAAAFPFAAATVTLCSRFPDLWQLILGHFYLRCPYLVPYYPVQDENQSDMDYHSDLGYKYIDGKIEETTNFLKRMHGFVSLYAAIVQTNPLPSSAKKHSHGLEHGWMLVSRILNLEPRPDITATVLLAFLEVTGHSLGKTYDKQFKKILHILCKDYFQKIKQINATGGPVGRLKDFLHSAITRGSIAPPDGILPNHFWRT